MRKCWERGEVTSFVQNSEGLLLLLKIQSGVASFAQTKIQNEILHHPHHWAVFTDQFLNDGMLIPLMVAMMGGWFP